METTQSGNTIQINYAAADEEWNIAANLSQYATAGLKIKSIEWRPSAPDDILRIRDGSTTGPYMWDTTGSDDLIKKFCGWHKPYIVYADQQFSVPGSINIIIILE